MVEEAEGDGEIMVVGMVEHHHCHRFSSREPLASGRFEKTHDDDC